MTPPDLPDLLGIRIEFLLFGLTLAGVALLHARSFEVAVAGLVAIVAYKLAFDPAFAPTQHLVHEAPVLVNLLGLLLGFAVLARHFEQSGAPEALPRWLPNGVAGAFALLAIVFVLSAFLDNIAAAMIGGTLALHVFKRRVDVGYLAAIVAASNAGGAGSVIGDTTTTMMWIEGVPWDCVLRAYGAAIPALLVFGFFAARQQHAHQPIVAVVAAATVDARRLGAVALILVGAIAANVLIGFPAAGVWLAILACAPFLRTDWLVLRSSLKGSLFLLALVMSASLMPVDALPAASWQTAFGLGFLSAVFDNIPLTKLALDQGGYDWGMLAYTIGFGGSMLWFGSSAGVAVANLFPQARSVGGWVRRGWHIPLAYTIGFAVMLLTLGWHPFEVPH
ncbi:MAG TPA: SLC13 family permease [Verrucomicrobiae bacterium]|nr:SLC13 family permease [Verrucomicrobiae bacterium]